jgi:hypothetical protein
MRNHQGKKERIYAFVLQPFFEMRNYSGSKILRVERPLITTRISNKNRFKVLKEINEYALDFAKSHSYDFIEMELYDRIDDVLYFPSSLSTVGSFNFPQDYKHLRDDSFEEIRTIVCFEIMKKNKQQNKGIEKIIKVWKNFFKKWNIESSVSRTIKLLHLEQNTFLFSNKSLQPYAFNFPEYFLSRKDPKQVIRWYPDLYLLSENNWRLLVGRKKEVYQRVMNINRGKICRFSGISLENLLSQINEIWAIDPLSQISKLQIFTDINDYDVMRSFGGKAIHTLRLLRKDVN